MLFHWYVRQHASTLSPKLKTIILFMHMTESYWLLGEKTWPSLSDLWDKTSFTGFSNNPTSSREIPEGPLYFLREA